MSKRKRNRARRQRELTLAMQEREEGLEVTERAIGSSDISWVTSHGLISDNAFQSGEPVHKHRSFYKSNSTVRAAISAKMTAVVISYAF